MLMESLPMAWNIQPGIYAIVGATAMLGGVFRSSISLVPSLECSLVSPKTSLCCEKFTTSIDSRNLVGVGDWSGRVSWIKDLHVSCPPCRL